MYSKFTGVNFQREVETEGSDTEYHIVCSAAHEGWMVHRGPCRYRVYEHLGIKRTRGQNLRSDLRRCVGEYLSSRAASSQVFSARQSLTSVFGMGTGGPSASISPTLHLQGFEPGTHWLRVSCSTNWAKGALGFPLKVQRSLKTKQEISLHASQLLQCFLNRTFVVQALGLLVSVSYTHYCAYTSDLSNS